MTFLSLTCTLCHLLRPTSCLRLLCFHVSSLSTFSCLSPYRFANPCFTTPVHICSLTATLQNHQFPLFSSNFLAEHFQLKIQCCIPPSPKGIGVENTCSFHFTFCFLCCFCFCQAYEIALERAIDCNANWNTLKVSNMRNENGST